MIVRPSAHLPHHLLLLVLGTVTPTHCLAGELLPAQASGNEAPVGSLVICGGGQLPQSVTQRFWELARGDASHLVVIPTASIVADQWSEDRLLAAWRTRPARSVTLLHTRRRDRANEPEFVSVLQSATGVWMMGGDQSRLAEAYVGTRVEQELVELLKRGGVVGGTSAGAAIMSRRMIAGGKREPQLATGFDLLPGAVIDQHFLRRNRLPRLAAAVEKHRDCFGLGIDEGAAVVVRGDQLEVIGDSTATIYLPERLDRRESGERNSYHLRPGDIAKLPELRSVLGALQARK